MSDMKQCEESACGKIAAALMAHVKSGAEDDRPLWEAHFDPGFMSTEGDGSRFEGIDAVEEKCRGWMAAHTVHSMKAEGPFVGPDGFAVRYELDVEPKDGSWPRMVMQEVGVYRVRGEKVVSEEFWYAPMGG